VTRDRVVAVVERVAGGGEAEAALREFDSIQLVELVVSIEEEFGLEIPDESLNDAMFRSVDALADAVARLGG
jgi:acyl carrier protein